ncbi:MAG: phosphatidate cytidylyltransferase, partial [Chloroflexi bacterium]|nr:phosphatidate cytidylyltransferase [Chloroflexota bacterium]
TWIADSAAYVVGKFLAGKFLLGRHQLSPRLSPNKTIEGYVGGIFFATLVTVIVGNLFGVVIWGAVLLGVLVSAISPLGDLAISLLKREAGVKDSGTLLPGHGGALDRVDSLVWSVTMGYYLALFLG